MKTILLFFVSTLLSISLFAQKRHKTQKTTKIDTLYLFQPLGYISAPVDGKVMYNDSLTKHFNTSFLQKSANWASFAVQKTENNADDSTLQYLVSMMYKMERISFESFENNRITERIKKALEPLHGRFFGVFCYYGYEQKNQLARTLGLFAETGIIGSAIISGGSFWNKPVPTQPILDSYFAIFDKENECALFFHTFRSYGNPTEDTNISDICRKYMQIIIKK